MMDQAAGTLIAIMLFMAMSYGWKNPAERPFFWIGFIMILGLIFWRTGCWTQYLACT